MLEFKILGALEVRADGRAISIGGRRQRALLAILLLHANAVVSADRLIDELWGERPPETAANTLQVHLSQLRKLLEEDSRDRRVLLTRQPGYVLCVDPEQVDALRFERLVEQGRADRERGAAAAAESFRAALELWRGPALADFAFDGFAQAEISRLEELRELTLEERVDADLALGRHAELVPELELLVARHPTRERLRGQLMLALYQTGRQADALAVYREGRDALSEELGLEPGPELRRLHQSILRQDESIEAVAPAPRRVTSPLPSFLTPLVGRERQVEEAAALLRREDVRLLTLTGFGGIGKTRLAVEAARTVGPELAGGTVFVPLAAITDPSLVAGSLVQALGLVEPGPREAVLDAFLRGRRTLLLLDNLEQVLAAVPLLARLLAAAPGLKLLVTSRAPLRIAGEREYPVPPLAADAAIDLFVARARSADAGFSLSASNAAAVEELCVRLEGLPLALELAAARTKLLTPEAMLGRLGGRLDLLAAGTRDAPERHRALRATVDWSYELLTEGQQRAFARFGVFVGGCSLEAAEAVCARDGKSVLDDVSAVVDESLVRRESAEEPRFAMLEAVREYALERLDDLGEDEDARGRHQAYFLGLAERAALKGPEQASWFTRLEVEHDNLRVAEAFSRERGDADSSLRFCVALWRFWQIHGHLDEGRRTLELALAASPAADPLLRARALNGAGVLAGEQGDFEAAAAYFEPSLELARQLDDRHRIAAVLTNLGNLALFATDFERARRLYEESLEYCAYLEEPEMELVALENLGLVALDQGDLGRAVTLLEQSAALAGRRGDERARSSSLRALAAALLERGEADRAFDPLAESLALARRLGELNGIAYCLDTFAGLAAADELAERAATLFGAADGVRSSIGALRPPDQQPLYERWLAQTLSLLDVEIYSARYEDGRSLSLDEACAHALRRAGSG